MGLPIELVSQFAKVTHTKKEKTERTFYGTIVEKDSKQYVQLDGSDVLTPIYTTVDMLAGERVVVMIKNHTAIVTGNISSPAARTDEVKSINRNWEAASKTATDFIIKGEDGIVFGDHAAEEDTELRIDAKTLHFYIKSIKEVYKPYYESGDSVSVEWHGSGFVSESTKVYFSIPLAKPVIGKPNVVISFENGLTIRQNGSSRTDNQPTYSATLTCDGGIINVIATLSSAAAANNAPCGVTASMAIAFS